MNNDWQHRQNVEQLTKLKEEGFEFEITSKGYRVAYKGEFIAAAGVKLPREKKQHWQHARADIRDYTSSALSVAKRYKESNPCLTS